MRLSIFALLFTSLAFVNAHAGFIGSQHHNGFNYVAHPFGDPSGHDDFGFNHGGHAEQFCGDIFEFYSGNWHTVDFGHGKHFAGHYPQNDWPVLVWYNTRPFWPVNWLDLFKSKHALIFDFDHDWNKKHARHWHKTGDHQHDDDDSCQWNCTNDPSFPPTALNNVPEPETLMLLLVSSLMLVACKRRYQPATAPLNRHR